MTPGAAVLLLMAVAASQVDLSLSQVVETQEKSFSDCPVTFYGKKFTRVETTIYEDKLEVCFRNDPSDPSEDCLRVMDAGGSVAFSMNRHTAVNTPGSALHSEFPNLKSSSTCKIQLKLYSYINTHVNSVTLTLYDFSPETILTIDGYNGYQGANFELKTVVGGSVVSSWSFTKQEFLTGLSLDITGCRGLGIGVTHGENAPIPATCSTVSCNGTGITSPVSICDPLESCNGAGVCRMAPMCTVTGSTVIDFNERALSVQDRCVYTLMDVESPILNFSISAGFRERQRKDVSFLDHLIINLVDSSVQIFLGQGGRVWVGDQDLMLSATSQMFYDVEFFKDHTGVTAKIANTAVLFDGNTAHLSGHTESSGGLCGNPMNPNMTTTVTAEKLTVFSADGCETQYDELVDSTINCSRSTAHTSSCNLMRQDPFTACHDKLDPEPYITACTNTLCNYPPVDGLDCQFFEAYAKVCRLENWRSTAGCPAAPKACLDQYCSDHEFCGERFGATHCLCRALFASKYRPTDALGEPTVCMQSSASLTLAGCLLVDRNIDYSNLHLNDPDCKGHMDSQTHMVTFHFDSAKSCGTEVMMNNSQVIFKNTIVTKNSSMEVITRQDQVEIDFSCFYPKPKTTSVSFKIRDSSVVQQIVSGVWNYSLVMNAYTDAKHMYLVKPSTEIQLGQKLWLELKTEGLDGNMVALVTDSCWAANQLSPGGNLRYDLIMNGCPNPADQTVHMEGNGQGTSNGFSFNVFQFSGYTTEIYLHCQVELCPTQGQSCAPSCGSSTRRRRRSSRSRYADGLPALITLSWTN